MEGNKQESKQEEEEEEVRSVAFDKNGEAVHGLKIKTMASQQFYLRVVRDVSFIDEDAWGCECEFEDVQNLRKFIVRLPGRQLQLYVSLNNLYPLAAPNIVFVGLSNTTIEGKSCKLSLDASGRLTNEELVGNGWNPILGVHSLIHYLCWELALSKSVPEFSWHQFLFGGHAEYVEEGSSFLSVIMEPVKGKIVLSIGCEAFCTTQEKKSKESLDFYGHAIRDLFKQNFGSISEESDLQKIGRLTLAKAEELVEVGDIGVSDCVTVISERKIFSLNLGDVCSYLLKTNKRRCKDVSVLHDAFNKEELERLEGQKIEIIKHGSSVRYIKDLSQVSRCVGLKNCDFIVHEPFVFFGEKELDDLILVTGNKAMFETMSALEMASIVCPKVSAKEMSSEIGRICKIRMPQQKIGVNIICL